MTIGSGWASLLKENVPAAFTSKCPRKPTVCFIDGQIKLNKSEHIHTWRQFLDICFINPIEYYFANGTMRVVLAFDNYELVPKSKGMTQTKRNKQTVNFTFGNRDALPKTPPPEWNACMRNRVFKTKVINMIVANLKRHFSDLSDTTLVLDYMQVEVLGRAWHVADALDGCNKNGESDCKAYDYAEQNVPLLIDSIDGDMLVLSMLHIKNNPSTDIMIRRILTKTAEERKRKRSSRAREYEFVSVPHLVNFIQTNLKLQPDPVTGFATMTALCGCDFTRNLPRLGESSLWKSRHNIKDCDLSRVDGILLALALFYLETFQKSVNFGNLLKANAEKTGKERYDEVWQKIQSTQKINPKIRDSIWSVTVAECHCRNVLWTLRYWEDRDGAPFPMVPEFGFGFGKKQTPQFLCEL